MLGSLIFILYAFLDTSTYDENSIVISKPEQEQLKRRWQKKHMRPPTTKEFTQMLDSEIYTEMMYKEALKMGLDKNDAIIRRRLAQKFEFLSTDVNALYEPTTQELKTYFNAHNDNFRGEELYSFKQIYISKNRSSLEVEKKLSGIKKALNEDENIENMGENISLAFMNNEASLSDIARMFGRGFAQKLTTLPTQTWQGPISSGYGLHFVYITKRTEGKLPSFESVQAKVKRVYQEKMQEQHAQDFYQELRKKYTIKIAK